MKITYIVGNGFDINLGLNIRYTDWTLILLDFFDERSE